MMPAHEVIALAVFWGVEGVGLAFAAGWNCAIAAQEAKQRGANASLRDFRDASFEALPFALPLGFLAIPVWFIVSAAV